MIAETQEANDDPVRRRLITVRFVFFDLVGIESIGIMVVLAHLSNGRPQY